MVRRTREHREELPGLARDQPQLHRFGGRRRLALPLRRAAGSRATRAAAPRTRARETAWRRSARPGWRAAARTSAAAVTASAAYKLRTKLPSDICALACTCAAELHSSSRCRTARRPSVRTIASAIRTASRGSVASWNSVRPKPLQRVVARACAASCRDRFAVAAAAGRRAPSSVGSRNTGQREHGEAQRTPRLRRSSRRRAAGRGRAPPACGAGCRASSSWAIAARSCPRRTEDPRQQLPVAARPAVAARRGDFGVRRIFLEQLDVAHEAAARVAAFEQVVREDRVRRHAAVQRALERVDLVHALAGERARARTGPGTRRKPGTCTDRRRSGRRTSAGTSCSSRVRAASASRAAAGCCSRR